MARGLIRNRSAVTVESSLGQGLSVCPANENVGAPRPRPCRHARHPLAAGTLATGPRRSARRESGVSPAAVRGESGRRPAELRQASSGSPARLRRKSGTGAGQTPSRCRTDAEQALGRPGCHGPVPERSERPLLLRHLHHYGLGCPLCQRSARAGVSPRPSRPPSSSVSPRSPELSWQASRCPQPERWGSPPRGRSKDSTRSPPTSRLLRSASGPRSRTATAAPSPRCTPATARSSRSRTSRRTCRPRSSRSRTPASTSTARSTSRASSAR